MQLNLGHVIVNNMQRAKTKQGVIAVSKLKVVGVAGEGWELSLSLTFWMTTVSMKTKVNEKQNKIITLQKIKKLKGRNMSVDYMGLL